MTTYVNATPHAINCAGTVYETTGLIARVNSKYLHFSDKECKAIYGEVQGLPEPREGVKYIVSSMVLEASDREDLVAPATGHPDVVRNDKGHILSVPRFRVK